LLSDIFVHQLHQSRFSRRVRDLPIVDRLAWAWWLRTQRKRFDAAFAGLKAPETPFEVSSTGPSLPTIGKVQQRDPGVVKAGDEFSAAMEIWCSTSKFSGLGYQDVYGQILIHLKGSQPRVLEVGIGVNDPTAPSGMPNAHRPGSSLIGWAKYFPSADVHGADVDERVLVDTADYETHLVDQRDPQSLTLLAEKLGTPLDLVIDDGLHTAEANALTAVALLPKLSTRGVLVIEDILPEYYDFWESLTSTIREEYCLVFYPGSTLRGDVDAGLAVFCRLA